MLCKQTKKTKEKCVFKVPSELVRNLILFFFINKKASIMSAVFPNGTRPDEGRSIG